MKGPSYPPINLLLVGNEENGETESMGTPHVLRLLEEETGYAPHLFIAGETTGEKGIELWGEICPENRGVARFDLLVRGIKGHSGVGSSQPDLSERLLVLRGDVERIYGQYLTLSSPDGWQLQARFPFMQVGTPGVYNVTPGLGVLGVEVRPMPQDDILGLVESLKSLCKSNDAVLVVKVLENGIICRPDNPYLYKLIQAGGECSEEAPRIGRKLPGTSARFAPGGQGVIWRQRCLGPHANDEPHYIPSIEPYYRALQRFSDLL